MGKALQLSDGEREAIARELFQVVGDRQGDELHGLCPFHGDNNPSFSYNIVKDVYNCFACQVRGDLIRMWGKLKGSGDSKADFAEFCRRYGIKLGDGERRDTKTHEKQHKKAASDTGGDQKKIIQAQIDAAWSAMPPLPDEWIRRMGEQRGWSADAIRRLDLRLQTRRWDKRAGSVVEVKNPDRLAIPVRDADGKLRNIRCYKPGAKEMKIISFAPGIGNARLFPAAPAKSDGVVLIVEGE